MSIFGPKNYGKMQSKIGSPKIETPKIDAFFKFWALFKCGNLWRRTVYVKMSENNWIVLEIGQNNRTILISDSWKRNPKMAENDSAKLTKMSEMTWSMWKNVRNGPSKIENFRKWIKNVKMSKSFPGMFSFVKMFWHLCTSPIFWQFLNRSLTFLRRKILTFYV